MKTQNHISLLKSYPYAVKDFHRGDGLSSLLSFAPEVHTGKQTSAGYPPSRVKTWLAPLPKSVAWGSAVTGNLLAMQHLRPYPRPTESQFAFSWIPR